MDKCTSKSVFWVFSNVSRAVYNNETVAAKKYNESIKASAQILHEVATMK